MPPDDTREPPQKQNGDPNNPGRWDRVKFFFGEVDVGLLTFGFPFGASPLRGTKLITSR